MTKTKQQGRHRVFCVFILLGIVLSHYLHIEMLF